jgi:hypothetical protein
MKAYWGLLLAYTVFHLLLRPPLVGKVSANLLRVAQRMPTAADLGFLDWSPYFFIQVAPQFQTPTSQKIW